MGSLEKNYNWGNKGGISNEKRLFNLQEELGSVLDKIRIMLDTVSNIEDNKELKKLEEETGRLTLEINQTEQALEKNKKSN